MPTAEGKPQTLYDKAFQDHIVDERLDGTILLYIGMAPAQCVCFESL
jgi:3-isopropylmalate dehydratase